MTTPQMRAALEAQRKWIRDICERLGIKPTQLARRAEIAPSTLNKLLKVPDWPHLLSSTTVQKIEAAAQVKAVDSNQRIPKRYIDAAARPLLRAHGESFGPDDLPVLGYAEGGTDGFFFDNGVVRDYIPRHPSLLRAANAYAIYMHGSSMEPKFAEGETLYVNPNRPPKPGQYVVIQFKNDRGLVKRLVRRTQRAVVVESLNPKREVEIDPGEIASIHLIVGSTIA